MITRGGDGSNFSVSDRGGGFMNSTKQFLKTIAKKSLAKVIDKGGSKLATTLQNSDSVASQIAGLVAEITATTAKDILGGSQQTVKPDVISPKEVSIPAAQEVEVKETTPKKIEKEITKAISRPKKAGLKKLKKKRKRAGSAICNHNPSKRSTIWDSNWGLLNKQ